MRQLRNEFGSEAEKTEYIADCERELEDRLSAVAREVLARPDLRLLALAGPTCSCKSTAVKKIAADLADAGKRVRVISIDDFFYSRTENREELLKADALPDFDSIEALDFPYLCQCLDSIFAGERTMLPIFDFVSAKRSGYTALDPEQYDLFLFEGIQAIYPEVTARFAEYGFLSVYVDVGGPVEIAGEVFEGRQIRLARRLVRDYRFRAAPPAFTMYLWRSVVENEDRNILPYLHTTELRIDTFFPYELGLLRDPLIEILDSVPPSADQYGQARELIRAFARIESFSESYLPRDSVYREFLG